MAVVNVLVLAVGALLAWMNWGPQHRSLTLAADAAAQTPTFPTSSLAIEDLGAQGDGSHLYHVRYSAETKNNSSRPVNITYSISALYLGVLQTARLGSHGSYVVNGPPSIWDDAPYGKIHWTLANYDASEVDGDPPKPVKDFFARKGLENRSPGGGLTGMVPPGASTSTEPEFVVRARPGEYVGVMVAYGIDDAVDSPSPDIELTSDFQRLGGGN